MGKTLDKEVLRNLGPSEYIYLIENLQEQVLLLKEQSKILSEKNKQLEINAKKNSRNSNKLSSTDDIGKKKE